MKKMTITILSFCLMSVVLHSAQIKDFQTLQTVLEGVKPVKIIIHYNKPETPKDKNTLGFTVSNFVHFPGANRFESKELILINENINLHTDKVSAVYCNVFFYADNTVKVVLNHVKPDNTSSIGVYSGKIGDLVIVVY